MATADVTFSEFEVDKLGFKFPGDEKHALVDCIGTMEEEMEVTTVDKKCRGVIVKHKVVPTGNGTLTVSGHMPKAVYDKIYAMDQETLTDGVTAYGYNKQHPVFSMTGHVFDEDGNEKLKAWPCTVANTGVTRSVENGADEVAEVEMELYVSPDSYGNGLYECLVADLPESMTAQKWMEEFDPATVQAPAA